MVTLIFLRGLCGYVWVSILTLPSQRGVMKGCTFGKKNYYGDAYLIKVKVGRVRFLLCALLREDYDEIMTDLAMHS